MLKVSLRTLTLVLSSMANFCSVSLGHAGTHMHGVYICYSYCKSCMNNVSKFNTLAADLVHNIIISTVLSDSQSGRVHDKLCLVLQL